MEQAPAGLAGWAVPQAHLVVKPAVPLLWLPGEGPAWLLVQQGTHLEVRQPESPRAAAIFSPEEACFLHCWWISSFPSYANTWEKIEIKVRKMVFCLSSSSHLFWKRPLDCNLNLNGYYLCTWSGSFST